MVIMKTEIAYKNSWYLMACIFLGNDNGRLNCGLEFWLLATPYYRKADCFCEPTMINEEWAFMGTCLKLTIFG